MGGVRSVGVHSFLRSGFVSFIIAHFIGLRLPDLSKIFLYFLSSGSQGAQGCMTEFLADVNRKERSAATGITGGAPLNADGASALGCAATRPAPYTDLPTSKGR